MGVDDLFGSNRIRLSKDKAVCVEICQRLHQTKLVFIHPVVGGRCCRCDTFDGNITNGKPGAPCVKGRPACYLLLIE